MSFERILLSVQVFCLVAGVGCGAGDSTNPGEESVQSSESSLDTYVLGARHPRDAGASKPAIVLVHGAFADAFGWHKVIRILDDDGYRVTAVENPLLSLATDVSTTRRVIDAESANGPIVVVGHSFGGAAVTGAAAGATNVKALVYIDAFAPDVGEPIGVLAAMNPSQLGAALVQDSAGFLTIDRTQFRDVFCGDLPFADALVLAESQKPVAASAFAETLTAAAWKTIPSYYLVGTDDQAIAPSTQRFMASRMGAQTIEVRASHAVFVSHPYEVARLIENAASGRRP